MATITAGDYTVELKIDADNYRHWYNNEFRKSGGDYENQVSPAMSLKKLITQKIEDVLTAELARSPLHEAAAGSLAGKSRAKKDRADLTKVTIADIVFSFKNQALILALRKRGSFIAN